MCPPPRREFAQVHDVLGDVGDAVRQYVGDPCRTPSCATYFVSGQCSSVWAIAPALAQRVSDLNQRRFVIAARRRPEGSCCEPRKLTPKRPGKDKGHLVRDVREGACSPIALHACHFLVVMRSPPGSCAGSHARLLAIPCGERALVPSSRLLELWYRTVH